MLFKNHVGCIVTSIVMLVLGLSMAIVGALASGQPITFAGTVTTWGCAFVINYLAALIFPVDVWGAALAGKLGQKPGSLGFAFINTLVSTFVFVTVVSLGMVFIQVGPGPMYWVAWRSLYPILFGAGLVIAFIVSLIAMKIAMGIVNNQ